MAAPKQRCVCHVLLGENTDIISLTDASWDKICECMDKWKDLDGIERHVAQCFDGTDRNSYGYHRRCYQRFTDKQRIAFGLKRKENGTLRATDDIKKVSQDTFIRSPALLRSRLSAPATSSRRRSAHVLPEECIICRQTKSVVDKSTLKRTRERLVSCQTSADKLLSAAKLKNDRRVLLQIGPLDPVSIEVRYHSSCYKQYTKCVYEDVSQERTCLPDTFHSFCTDIIEERMISNGEVLKMSYLTKQFIKLVSQMENRDISDYRNFQLKKRLQKRYPLLEFIQPSARSCELVFYQNEGEGSILNVSYTEDIMYDTADTDSESESTTVTDHTFMWKENIEQERFAEIYRTAMIIKSEINSTPGLSVWPPMAQNLSMEKCSDAVPSSLFNFLAWCCGVAENFNTERVDVQCQQNKRRILSLAQDLITLASQGRKLMPKQVALGMTVRHLTGSAKLQQLLNSFGHCVSHSFTLEHDTALATKQLESTGDIPEGFQSEEFTTLVWDNNDFGEETLTGKGTTHNTNGIIIQRQLDINSHPSEARYKPMGRDRKRTIKAPASNIPLYHATNRCGPNQFQGQKIDLSRETECQERAKCCDLGLLFAKFGQADVLLPSWTGCNQMLAEDTGHLDNIGYLPVIDASPTEPTTVNAILERSLDIVRYLKLPSLVVVMDQAIYSKAQQIRWQGKPELRERLVLRLGEFHTAMAFLGAIGKRFEGSGLVDIAIESGLVAEGSISGVMSGHHYNRSLRCHKIISESLHRLRLREYLDTLTGQEHGAALLMIQQLHNSFPDTFNQTLHSEEVKEFQAKYQKHIDLRCNQNAMYCFWTSYLNMVDLLLLFLRATREGNWQLHLSAVRDMIPWYFAYGRINYARYLPVYYLEMKALPSSHPFVHSNLAQGAFAVKRHQDHAFARTACDQVIEQTFNRDSKTRGGMTGITLNKGAVKRWILSQPARAGIANACYSMSSIEAGRVSQHSETTTSRICADEQAVNDVMMTVEEFTNPFTFGRDNELINICSGKVASDNLRLNLAHAYALGEDSFQEFVNKRLLKDKSEGKDIFEKLTLPAGKTFLTIDKKTCSKASLTKASIAESRHLFARLLMVAQEKGLELTEVLKYPLATVPAALAHFDGSMNKTNKAGLLHEVLNCIPEESLNQKIVFHTETVVIVDGMALIQQQHQVPETFGEFAASILTQLVSVAKKYHARRIDFVADRYKAESIKQYERNKRSTRGETKVRITRQDQKMPKQMQKFLACGTNKDGLLNFIVDEWKLSSPCVLSGLEVYATQAEKCFRLYESSGVLAVEEVCELESEQEEADTRMFLHAFHASQIGTANTDIIIRTVDTDVFLLSLWVSTVVTSRVILHLVTRNSKHIDMREVNKHLGEGVAEALLGLHPFTGCDTVSAFKGKGKVKALKLMMKSPAHLRTFCDLGKEWAVSDSLTENLEKFVCELYGWAGCDNVDKARYNCFRFGSVSDAKMPPNRDALKLHLMRANYQTRIYRLCLQNTTAPNPVDHGWKVKDNELTIKWTTLPIAPDSVLQVVNCGCKKSCDSLRCSCRKAGMDCTDMCKCCECLNRQLVPNDGDLFDTQSDDPDSECDC